MTEDATKQRQINILHEQLDLAFKAVSFLEDHLVQMVYPRNRPARDILYHDPRTEVLILCREARMRLRAAVRLESDENTTLTTSDGTEWVITIDADDPDYKIWLTTYTPEGDVGQIAHYTCPKKNKEK